MNQLVINEYLDELLKQTQIKANMNNKPQVFKVAHADYVYYKMNHQALENFSLMAIANNPMCTLDINNHLIVFPKTKLGISCVNTLNNIWRLNFKNNNLKYVFTSKFVFNDADQTYAVVVNVDNTPVAYVKDDCLFIVTNNKEIGAIISDEFTKSI